MNSLDEFMQLLSDEAATPNAHFVANLKAKTLSMPAGEAVSSATAGTFTIKKIIFIIAAVLGASAILTAFVLSSRNTTREAVETGGQVVEEIADQADGFTNDLPTVVSDEDAEDAATTDDQDVPALETYDNSQSNTTENTTQGQPNNSETSDSAGYAQSAALNTPYVVEFWNLSAYSGDPVMQDDAPDYSTKSTDLDYDWGLGSPVTDIINEDQFVARATKTMTLDEGLWDISFSADDGIRVFIDGELIIDHWLDGVSSGSENYEVSERFDAEIVVEYVELENEAFLKVSVIQQ